VKLSSANNIVIGEKMLNIAIGFAFIIGIFLSPGSNFLSIFIDMDLVKHGLKPYQYHLTSLTINILIPSAAIYSIINCTNIKNILITSKKISAAIFISNIVLFLYIAARTFASTIEGGGGSYVVQSFSFFTFLPATIVLGFSLILITKKSIVERHRYAQTRKPNIALNVFVAVSMILPAGYVVQLLQGDKSPYKQAKIHESTFDKYCSQSGEKILVSVNERVDSLYLKTGDASFRIGSGGKVLSSGYGEIITMMLSRGNLGFVEFDNESKRNFQSKYLKRSSGERTDSPVEILSSKYGVVAEKLVSEADRAKGIRGERVEVVNLQTGEVIAHTTYFFNKPLWQFCGHAPNGAFSTFEFIRRVIPLG